MQKRLNIDNITSNWLHTFSEPNIHKEILNQSRANKNSNRITELDTGNCKYLTPKNFE